jgi:hypothetical protein
VKIGLISLRPLLFVLPFSISFWWFLLNLGTIRATSSLLKGEELKFKKNRSAELKYV